MQLLTRCQTALKRRFTPTVGIHFKSDSAKLKQMRYFKYIWNETRGDQYDNWGHSLWYLEIGEDDFPSRQIEIYDNGKILKYSQDRLEDEFGGLGDQKLDMTEYNGTECTETEFEENWNR